MSQREVIERILRGHQSEAMVGGLWEGPIRTRSSPRAPPGNCRRVTNAPNELQLVLDSQFLESDRLEAQLGESRELQLVLDPEFLSTAVVRSSRMPRGTRPLRQRFFTGCPAVRSPCARRFAIRRACNCTRIAVL